MRIIFAHGLEGSPQGRKAVALAEAGLAPLVPDCRGLLLADRVSRIEDQLQPGDVLVGSSYGGLAVALVAARRSARVAGLVLLAPALELPEPPNHRPRELVAPPGLPVRILHGMRDTVVPIGESRRYRDRSGTGVVLEEVDDVHDLNGSLDRMVALVREVVALAEGGPAHFPS